MSYCSYRVDAGTVHAMDIKHGSEGISLRQGEQVITESVYGSIPALVNTVSLKSALQRGQGMPAWNGKIAV